MPGPAIDLRPALDQARRAAYDRPLKFKCWAVTHRAAFMDTAAGLGVIYRGV